MVIIAEGSPELLSGGKQHAVSQGTVWENGEYAGPNLYPSMKMAGGGCGCGVKNKFKKSKKSKSKKSKSKKSKSNSVRRMRGGSKQSCKDIEKNSDYNEACFGDKEIPMSPEWSECCNLNRK